MFSGLLSSCQIEGIHLTMNLHIYLPLDRLYAHIFKLLNVVSHYPSKGAITNHLFILQRNSVTEYIHQQISSQYSMSGQMWSLRAHL
jgi:hypothetical protein